MCVWGYKQPDYINVFCKIFGVQLIRIEDGFLRSVSLGKELKRVLTDQTSLAHSLCPIDIMRQGWLSSLYP